MAKSDHLFSPDVAARYRASIAAGLNAKPAASWPSGCWGAANAWLILVGPSPGAPPAGGRQEKRGPNRPSDSRAKIGGGAGLIRFDTNTGRNGRWDMLRTAACVRRNYADALTAVANLDGGYNASQKTIPDKYLNAGCRPVYDVILHAKPRVIVTLTRKAWETFSEFLQRSCELLPINPRAADLDSMLIQLPGLAAPTLVMRSPQHPSQPFFTQEHAKRVGDQVSRFLRLQTA